MLFILNISIQLKFTGSSSTVSISLIPTRGLVHNSKISYLTIVKLLKHNKHLIH